jgi:hypothetical protein
MVEFVEYEDMPDDNEDLIKLDIAFPYLDEIQIKRNPNFIQDLLEYLHLEGETVSSDGLNFIKAVKVKEQKYWIWEFSDKDREHCYAVVGEDTSGVLSFSYDLDWYHLTPDQFILGEYHNVF